ncbi:hypothetical protein BJX76DRAFT_251188 [Aspergillus varians]
MGSSGAEDLKSSIQSWLDENLTPYLDDRTIETIFRRYVASMAPTFPVVVFSPGTTAADIRNANPILFLSILDVASSGFCALEIERKIRKLIVQTYVHCMLRTEQYTLDLLQALIVSAAWYRTIEPVEPGEQMDIYQISHTAANMALIMRLGESLKVKSRGSPMFPRSEKTKGPGSSFQAESLETRRVWLGCHYICSNTSMSLHAPNVMRWTRTMDECLEVLETSPAALPSDKVLCRHIRLQHITEEFAMQLSAEEPSTLDQNRVIQKEVTHRTFKQQLDEWRTNVVDSCWDGSLEFSYHFARLYVCEVAHCTATSDVPYADNTQPSSIVIEPHAFTEFMDIIDKVVRLFTSLDMSTIRALPAMYLIRIIYTFMILVKLHFATTKIPTKNQLLPVDVGRLQVSQRLNHVLQMFAGWGPLWPATKLTTAFLKLRSWFESEEDGNQQTCSWLTVWAIRPTSMNVADATYDDGLTAASSHCPSASTDEDTLRSWLDPPLLSIDLPNIEQLNDTTDMHLDWSRFPNMCFDLDASFSPIPDSGCDSDTMKGNYTAGDV